MPISYHLFRSEQPGGNEAPKHLDELTAGSEVQALQEALNRFGVFVQEVVTPTDYNGVTYTVRDHVMFVQEMESNGFRVHLYRRELDGWTGPAVVVDTTRELERIRRLRSVALESDHYGNGELIYHPVESDPNLPYPED